jgi:hypothetical protein
MCDVDFEGGSWAWWSFTPREARKPHKCDACGTPIRPGEPYLDHRHIHREDGMGAGKACAPCGLSIQAFGDSHNFWTSPDSIEEFLRDCVVDEDAKGGWRDHVAGIIKRRRAAKRLTREVSP